MRTEATQYSSWDLSLLSKVSKMNFFNAALTVSETSKTIDSESLSTGPPVEQKSLFPQKLKLTQFLQKGIRGIISAYMQYASLTP